MASKRAAVYAITFLVATCSIGYELIYSEMLTVILGAHTLRYALTIGLFMFSFGVGSIVFNYIDDSPNGFFRAEILLAAIGPAGLIFIVLINSFPQVQIIPFQQEVILVASHLPILAVGFLSGLEIPYLTNFISTRSEKFSWVIGIDYFGSLAGTVFWAAFLYPDFGIIPAVFVLGLINAIVALYFALIYSDVSRILLVICLLLTVGFTGVLTYDDDVETALTNQYLSNQYEAEYPSGSMNVEITEHHNTRYQSIVKYNRTWNGSDRDAPGSLDTETCMRLDSMLQLCDSWADSYHSGLVDVPMAAFNQSEYASMNVLILGGGDWIAIDHLRAYGVQVDQVDLDRGFKQYAKDDPYLQKYHNNAYRYDRLNSTTGDAYTYLRNTEKKYDLILFDLPGIRNDNMLKLYSTEFYTLMRGQLTDRGIAVTWGYSRYWFPEHYKAFMNTVEAGGFDSITPYHAWDDLDEDGDLETGEKFYLLSPAENPERQVEPNNTKAHYVRTHTEKYQQLRWVPTPRYNGVEPNSIFDPNYDIIINPES